MAAFTPHREIDWPAVLADFRRSGMTHVQFCSARRLSIHAFRHQLYRLRPGLPPRRPRADRKRWKISSASSRLIAAADSPADAIRRSHAAAISFFASSSTS